MHHQSAIVRLAAFIACSLIAASCSFGDSSGDSAPNSSAPDSTDVSTETGDGTTSDTTQESSSGDETSAEIDPGTTTFGGESGYSNEDPSYLGNPIWVTGPGNIPVKSTNDVAIRFVARYSGPVEGASFIIKYDFERPNYHGGDCGTLEVTLRQDDNGVPSDAVLGVMTFEDPCGGERDIGWLTDAAWEAPVDLVGGETYHVVFSNTDPDPTNFVSINMLYRPTDDARPLALSTGDRQLTVLARGSEFWSGNAEGQWGQSADLIDHHPSFELHYADGTSQGVSYVGARFGSEIFLEPDGPERVRQVFSVSSPTSVRSVWFRGVEASDDAEVVATLAEKDGAVLYNGSLSRSPGEQWFHAQLPLTLDLVPGIDYTVEVAATSGLIEVRPLYQADHDDWISTEQSDWQDATIEVASASGDWGSYVNQLPHDLSLFFETAVEDETAFSDPVTVAVYGDSLVNEPEFEELLRTALDARGVELVEKNSVSGRTTAELLGELETTVIPADYYLINVGINGGETPASFESSVTTALDLIYSQNPDAVVLWSSLHALEGGVDGIIEERVEPRNEVLESIAAAGGLTLVDWYDTAAANPEIYGSDGVHYFGNEQLYVQTMVGALDLALAAAR